MKWSWRIGKIAGIDVYVHATFLILLAWIGLGEFFRSGDLGKVAVSVGFMLTVFFIVVLHELGHALTARRFGIKTKDIVLLPIGGVARLEKMPENPRHEILVGLAGPAVNVVLALALGAIVSALSGLDTIFRVDVLGDTFLPRLVWVNVFLAVFNLIPAFPMDGGRVLRAMLALRMDRVRATQIAAHLGQGLALLMGLLGLFFNPVLVFIALFIWMGAAEESAMTQMSSALHGIPVEHAMVTEFHVLRSDDGLDIPTARILAGFQADFPVVDGQRVVGVLTREDLFKALADRGAEGRVADAMQTQFQVAHPGESLEGALARLQDCACRSMPVLVGDRLVGMVTMDNVSELLMVQTALRDRRRGRRPASPYASTRGAERPGA
jgi:Zn-dependent protease/CBS domain-containing protein